MKYALLILFALIVVRSSAQTNLPPMTRAQIMERAAALAEHGWDCKEVNLTVTCPQEKEYKSDWKKDEHVTGIPYDWGGMDDIEHFDQKLADGQAAGSHSQNGVTPCTTGIDCSGFVSYCWGQKSKLGTVNMRQISGRPKYNVYTDMKPGDALNKSGSHIVLFVKYKPDGNPLVYEAQGAAGRVILNPNRTWNNLKGYKPLQYLNVIEE